MEKKIFSKVAGVTYGDRQAMLTYVSKGLQLRAVREPGNPYDFNAIKILNGYQHLGYISKDLAATIAPLLDSGKNDIEVIAQEVTGQEKGIYGLNIKIILKDANFIIRDSAYSMYVNDLGEKKGRVEYFQKLRDLKFDNAWNGGRFSAILEEKLKF